ncbi:uncharacterized protein Z519_08263 [Cladophialophora bantiana CBS 173.52]|uniref:Putative lipoate-protein ligase A n=1 Tax=Cladophialophora bantiana (strain ATCC 10958 / CBS 173.52 / CDC B-1940 / NIH 8579) TaxID=1442370 RepID=A0A0D2FY16_CLAB1|nr:uncharacterized protein Z519_08263 [Cladophialophora bantiana CBS 173.52]KIW91367.1 hypothetical protein Z519_08263 [Cladophialophora bantiana CBS 173.52]
MRPAPWLLLTSSNRLTSSRPTKLSQAWLLRAVQRRRVHSGAKADPDPTWDLKELSRISQETGALIFHLTSDNPFLNLSIEHFLLTKSHPDSRILLFYTNRPCVVVGRNQNPWLEVDLKRLQEGLPIEQQSVDAPKRAGQQYSSATESRLNHSNASPEIVPIDLVRRRSGGGTVFHDSGNLNYSVIVPNTKAFKRSTHAEMVVRGLESLARAGPRPSSSSAIPGGRYGFSSVRVNERNDIVMQQAGGAEWLKVSGSAYKLTRGRALHHGTLLYSSPYMDKISELLRSPGRGLISAKGVESVRSKVGNLAWTPDPRERAVIRAEITEAITREFWKMYGGGDNKARKPGVDEITIAASCPASSSSSSSSLSPEGWCNENNPAIASGMQELTSASWVFEQTPRFEFASGMVENHEVGLSANRGVLKSLTLRSPGAPGPDQSGDGGTVWTTRTFRCEGQDQESKVTGIEKRMHEVQEGEAVDEVKMHDVKGWRDLLTKDEEPPATTTTSANSVPNALVQRLEAIFPRFQSKSKSGR